MRRKAAHLSDATFQDQLYLTARAQGAKTDLYVCRCGSRDCVMVKVCVPAAPP
jgi:hypothetical protein